MTQREKAQQDGNSQHRKKYVHMRRNKQKGHVAELDNNQV